MLKLNVPHLDKTPAQHSRFVALIHSALHPLPSVVTGGCRVHGYHFIVFCVPIICTGRFYFDDGQFRVLGPFGKPCICG